MKLEYLKNNLESFSLAAKTVEASKYRSRDETTVYSKIENGLQGSKETCKTHRFFVILMLTSCWQWMIFLLVGERFDNPEPVQVSSLPSSIGATSAKAKEL